MNPESQLPRLVLVDDHAMVLESLQKLLEPHYPVVGSACEAKNLACLVEEVHPDIVLMDVSMPGRNGFDTTRDLKANFPKIKIIFVSMHTEPMWIMEAFRAGADGFVPKQSVSQELIVAVKTVHDRKRYFSPTIPESVENLVLNHLNGVSGNELSGKLTARQKEVLMLIAQGFSAKDMADSLKISESTIAFHKAQIIQSLGLKSKAELTKYAVHMGLSPLK